MNWVTFNTHVFTYVFVTLSILQSQFIEKGFKKAKNSEQNVVLLLFLFTLDKHMLVAAKHVFCCDKNMFVATKLLS